MGSHLIIVSHYPAASGAFGSLCRLLGQLTAVDSDVVVVCNGSISAKQRSFLQCEALCAEVLVRPNEGMNIGAWRYGLQACPGSQYYHFLQDESILISKQFLPVYESFLAKKDVGLVGDSLNLKWNKPWNDLARSTLNFKILADPGNYLDRFAADSLLSVNSVDRVTYYRQKLKQWRCPEGSSAIHMRALNWSLSSTVLNDLDFPIGFSKQECIAAEIYVSRFLISRGLKVIQPSKQPFSYVGHAEWMNPHDPQRKSNIK